MIFFWKIIGWHKISQLKRKFGLFYRIDGLFFVACKSRWIRFVQCGTQLKIRGDKIFLLNNFNRLSLDHALVLDLMSDTGTNDPKIIKQIKKNLSITFLQLGQNICVIHHRRDETILSQTEITIQKIQY